MSQCMNLKTPRSLGYSRRGSRLTWKISSLQDVNSQYSNHRRCSPELCSTVIKRIDDIAKVKTLTTFSSVGPSIDHQNSNSPRSQLNQPSPQKRPIVGRINEKTKSDISKCTHKELETANVQSSSRTQSIHQLSSCLKDANSAALQNFPEDGTGLLESCSVVLSKDTRKKIKQRPRGSFYAPTISSTLRLIASRDTKKGIKSCSQGAVAGVKKCNLIKNNSSILEVISSASSHSIPVPRIRDTLTSKMYLERESSNSRPKSTSSSSNRKLFSLNTRFSTVSTLNASSMTNRSKVNDHLVMVKPLEHSKRGATRRPVTKISILGASRNTSRSLDNELSSACHNAPRRKHFSRGDVPTRPTSSPVLGKMLSFCDPSANKDPHCCNNTEGIVEPPMILATVENNQERTNEHMLESESNLSLRRFNHHDQHRELRMDIDNMSYEELLELVEKIGSVSTGLTDEAFTKCLKRSKFNGADSPFGITGCVEDDNRCSICQEECANGEDIGILACEHWYHAVCIQKWLMQKNWCPICKSPACANK